MKEVLDILDKKIQNGILNENKISLQIDTFNSNKGHFVTQILQKGKNVSQRLIK